MTSTVNPEALYAWCRIPAEQLEHDSRTSRSSICES
jgi:hypothetical protein